MLYSGFSCLVLLTLFFRSAVSHGQAFKAGAEKASSAQSVEQRQSILQGEQPTPVCAAAVSLELFFAVLLFAGGPAYAVAIYVAVVTSRRISEVLLLRGEDFCSRVDQTTTVHTCFSASAIATSTCKEMGN